MRKKQIVKEIKKVADELGHTNPWAEDDDTGYDHDAVDVIASGYEWTCPSCDSFNKEIEYKEQYTCPNCQMTFKTKPPEHAYGGF